MPSKKPTKAQLAAELAKVTQERDDAWIARDAAQRALATAQARHSETAQFPRRMPSKIVELYRECTPQGDVLRASDAVYKAAITPRDDGTGYKVVAPLPDGKPLVAWLNPEGVGHLPEHVVLKLVKA